MQIQNRRKQRSPSKDLPQRREVDAVVRELARLVREATVDLSLKVGQVVVERFFDGDALNWREHQQISFRRLARHPELPMSASALRRCVGLYELTQRLGDLTRFERLGASHFRAVLGLNTSLQRDLLAEANEQAWTVAELESRVAKLRHKPQGRGGRPRVPPLVKLIRQLEPLAEAAALQLANPEDAADLSELDVHEAHALAVRLSVLFRDLEQRFEEALDAETQQTA